MSERGYMASKGASGEVRTAEAQAARDRWYGKIRSEIVKGQKNKNKEAPHK